MQSNGEDIPCRAGKPISEAMSGGVSQCTEACPHYQDCFHRNGEPWYGRILPMPADYKEDATDEKLMEYLEGRFPNHTEKRSNIMIFKEKMPDCVPEYYRSMEADEQHRYEIYQRKQEGSRGTRRNWRMLKRLDCRCSPMADMMSAGNVHMRKSILRRTRMTIPALLSVIAQTASAI